MIKNDRKFKNKNRFKSKFWYSFFSLRRRGTHIKGHETNYSNLSFKYANELKMLNRIKSEVPESVINEINPEVIKVAQDNLLKKREKQLKESSLMAGRNYGGPLSNYDWDQQNDLQNRRRDYQYELSQQQKSDTFEPHQNLFHSYYN